MISKKEFNNRLHMIILFLIIASLHNSDATFISSGGYSRISLNVRHNSAHLIQKTKISTNSIIDTRRVQATPLRVVADDQIGTEAKQTQQQKVEEETEKLSALDARVLQSLLQDDSLDLKSEENLRKMLDNGVKKKESSRTQATDTENESEFSSSFFKAMNDSELWNSFTAKAETLVESAKIFVQNRIERDAQLLASIGVFAWERALRDVGRALPSAGKSGAGMAKKMRDSLFLLTNNSSFIEYIPKDNFVLPPSKYSEGVETSVFEELNTPLDEIKSVTKAIRDILSGKSVAQERGLRSVAPAGTSKSAVRQKMAFERKKETVLKREKEGIDAKVMRATSTLTDAAWELKREMEVEGNEAGYRAKSAQRQLEGTLGSAGFLSEGAHKPFRGIGERLFGAKRSTTAMPKIESFTDSTNDKLFTIADLDFERERVVQSLNECLINPSESWLKPGVADIPTKAVMGDGTTNISDENVTESLDGITDAAALPHHTLEEKSASTKTAGPSMTISNEASWENLITTMVLTRNDIEAQSSNDAESFDFNEEDIFAELRKLESTVNMLSLLAAVSAGYEAAQVLKSVLLGDAQDSLLSSLDYQISLRKEQQNRVEDRKRFVENQRKVDENRIKEEDAQTVIDEEQYVILEANFKGSSSSDARFVSSEGIDSASRIDTVEAVVVSEVIPNINLASSVSFKGKKRVQTDVEFQVMAISNSAKPKRDGSIEEEDEFDGVYTNVEIVDEVDEGQFIRNEDHLNSAAFDGQPAEKTSEPPIIARMALRSIDVVLFVTEKTFTVGVPGIFNAYCTFKERTEGVSRNGLGREGWEQLENLDDASKRY